MKRILTTMCALTLLLAASVPALAAEPEQSASYYPTSVEEYMEGDSPRIKKVYQLSLADDPSQIPTEDFERDGRLYYLLDMTRKDEVGVDIQTITQTKTLASETNNMEKILQSLEPQMEVTTEDGYTGTLTLDHTTVKVSEDASRSCACHTAKRLAAGKSVLYAGAPGQPSPQRETGTALACERGRPLGSSSLRKTATRHRGPQAATSGVWADKWFSCAAPTSCGGFQAVYGQHRKDGSKRARRAGQIGWPSHSPNGWDWKAGWETACKSVSGPTGPPCGGGGSQAGTNPKGRKGGPCDRQTGRTGGKPRAPRRDRGS